MSSPEPAVAVRRYAVERLAERDCRLAAGRGYPEACVVSFDGDNNGTEYGWVVQLTRSLFLHTDGTARPLEFAGWREAAALREAGVPNAEIALRMGLSRPYVSVLLDRWEQWLAETGGVAPTVLRQGEDRQ